MRPVGRLLDASWAFKPGVEVLLDPQSSVAQNTANIQVRERETPPAPPEIRIC